jgi:hypothetical protein
LGYFSALPVAAAFSPLSPDAKRIDAQACKIFIHRSLNTIDGCENPYQCCDADGNDHGCEGSPEQVGPYGLQAFIYIICQIHEIRYVSGISKQHNA